MKTKMSANTLQEDLNALGIPGLNENVMASVALGTTLSEGGCSASSMDDEEEDGEEEDSEEYDESRHDPMDGPFVTPILFDRIMGLPFDSLSEEDVSRVIEGLKVKRIPSNIRGIQERAQEVAQFLLEMRGKAVMKFRAGSTARKRTYVCPEGYRQNPKGGGCIRSAVAVGSAGKLAQQKRHTALWSKSGKGKQSSKRSERYAARRGEEFAVELEHLLGEQVERSMSVRDEILSRIGSIVGMIAEEFGDESVAQVFESALEPVVASYEAGRLDEDVMDVDTFMTEIRPVMTLISKSLDRLDRDGLGN